MEFLNVNRQLKCKGYTSNNKIYQDAKKPVSRGYTESDYQGLTVDEKEQWINNGGWIGQNITKGFIIVDVDSKKPAENLVKILDSEKIRYGLISTPNGMQFIFRNNGQNQSQKAITSLGIMVDYRSESGYIILPTDNTKNRLWVKQINTIDDVDEIPKYLLLSPILTNKKNTDNKGIWFSEGDRDVTYKNHAIHLLSSKSPQFSEKEVLKILTLINNYNCFWEKSQYPDKDLRKKVEVAKRYIERNYDESCINLSEYKSKKDDTIISKSNGLIDVTEVKDGIPTIPCHTGFPSLDKVLRPQTGELIVWVAENGSGKSTFLGQVLLSAVNNGHKVYAYSSELQIQEFQAWLYRQAAEKNEIESYIDAFGAREYKVKDKYLPSIKDWLRGNYFIYDNETEISVIKNMESALKKGCKIFLIDNLMSTRISDDGGNMYQAQSKFVHDISQFAKKNNVCVHLVTHPRKKQGNEKIEKQDIAGSMNISDYANSVISITRTPKDKIQEKGYNCMVAILKSRRGSSYTEVCYAFSQENKRFIELQETPSGGLMFPAINSKYSWVRPGERQQPKFNLPLEDYPF